MRIVSIFILSILIIDFFNGCREDINFPDEEISENGSIIISSIPPGARIYVDGIFRGKYTPDTLANLQPGIYHVELQGNFDVSDTTFEVYLQEGKQLSYNIQLRNLDNR